VTRRNQFPPQRTKKNSPEAAKTARLADVPPGTHYADPGKISTVAALSWQTLDSCRRAGGGGIIPQLCSPWLLRGDAGINALCVGPGRVDHTPVAFNRHLAKGIDHLRDILREQQIDRDAQPRLISSAMLKEKLNPGIPGTWRSSPHRCRLALHPATEPKISIGRCPAYGNKEPAGGRFHGQAVAGASARAGRKRRRQSERVGIVEAMTRIRRAPLSRITPRSRPGRMTGA